MFVVACDSSHERPGDEEPRSSVYRHSFIDSPSSVDPLHAASTYAGAIVLNVYDTLLRYQYLARPLALRTNLASDMPIVAADGKTYTITLRKGVVFADDECFADGVGREVIAQDVVFSMLRHFDPAFVSQGQWLWADLFEGMDEWVSQGADYDAPPAGIRALDRYTVQFKLRRAFPQFLHTLANPFSAVVPHEAVEFYGPRLAAHPVGSGPFRLAEFESTYVRLVRNEDYRQEVFDPAAEGIGPTAERLGLAALAGHSIPLMDEVEIRFLPDTTARWLAYRKGEIDFLRVAPELEARVFEKTGQLTNELRNDQWYAGVEASFAYLAFNMDDPEIGEVEDPVRNEKNRELRCAIRDAFDWEARRDILHGGRGRLFAGLIPPMFDEFDPTQQGSVVRDMDRARGRLEHAGWTAENLPELRYSGVGTGRTQMFFELFRSWMMELGFPPDKVQYRPYASWGEYARAVRARTVQFMDRGWSMDYPDVQNALQLAYGPNASPGANAANLVNPEFDRLFESVAPTSNPQDRLTAYRAANQVLIDTCALISGIARESVYVIADPYIAQLDSDQIVGVGLRFVGKKKGASSPP